jgi:hypothetical protein
MDAMINSLQARFAVPAVWLLACAAAGTVVAQLVTCWISLCGTSFVSLIALITGFASGTVLMDWVRERLLPRDHCDDPPAWALPLISGSLVTMTWLTPLLMNATLLAGCETFGTGGSLQSVTALLFPAFIVAISVSLSGCFVTVMASNDARPWNRSALAGAAGLLISLIHLAVTVPIAATVTFAICGTLIARWFVMQQIVKRHSVPSTSPGEQGRSRPSSDVPEAAARQVLHALATGLLLVVVCEMLSHIIPVSLPVLAISCVFAAIALSLLAHAGVQRVLTSTGLLLISLMATCLLPILFGSLANMNLGLSQPGSGVFATIALRAVQLAVFLSAATLPLILSGSSASQSGRPGVVGMILAIGMVSGLVGISRGVSLTLLLTLGVIGHAIAALLWTLKDSAPGDSANRWLPALTGRRWRFVVAGVSVAVFALLMLPREDFARTSSLVFSPRTKIAMQRGLSRELIPQSEASRLVDVVRSENGELSVWRRSGSLFEFQRNGVSLGRVSSNTTLSPQPPEEILPVIMGLVSHPKPSRILLLGDDTGASLRSCTQFPIQEIVAIRSDEALTELARRFTWQSQDTPADQDSRVTLIHQPQSVVLRNRALKSFDVVVSSGDLAVLPSAAFQFTAEFYQAACSRMTSDGVFCQRFRQGELGPEPIKQTMATMMSVFEHVGAVQMVAGEILLFGTNTSTGLVDPQILSRLQRDHVRREIASTGWDWSQVAVLPLLNANDPIGLFNHEKRPGVISISNGGLVMSAPLDALSPANRMLELNAAFGPHQMQFLAAIPTGEEHQEVQRRLSALAQQLEILAGMPDQPWTYRKSLKMEMQRTPRAPVEIIRDGEIVKKAHPLDQLRKDYFVSLGKALTAAAENPQSVPQFIAQMELFPSCGEPLISFFSNYEIVRLHELAHHPATADEFRHRLQIVFQANPTDASVRPVISAIDQLVREPSLIADVGERYDILNSLVQKLIERWEARTAWEPRSALRVQNDVDQSVRVTNRALQLMEETLTQANVKESEFRQRRRFVNAALISPLRDYRDQVLAHRMKNELPAEPDTEDPNDLPLLIPQTSQTDSSLTN